MTYQPQNPNGQAAAANSAPVVLNSEITSTVPAARGSAGVITTPAQQKLFRTTFAAAMGSGVDSTFFSTIQTGSGQAVSQASGNLVITSGTTANAETMLRSVSSFTGSMLTRIQTILSQRIANNNFYLELVDVIGDSLVVTVNSATSITVTFPSTTLPGGATLSSANVGQSMYIGAVQNISATAVPGRYAIASVSGTAVTFTVAGWPASGSGTCSVFGWNYYQLTYTSTTATNANYDAQRRGWNSGVTTATINTTASPGHMAVMMNNDGTAYLADQLIASVAGTVQLTQRASRVVNLPDETAPLYLQIRAANGSTAPASTTTWTLGMASVENYAAQSVALSDVKAIGPGSQTPVAITNTPAMTISSGTVTTVSTVASVTAVAALNSVATTNGLSIGTVVTAATPATTSIKATAGRLFHISVGNPNASAAYLKVFNVAAPTLGTTAANMNYLIPATSQTTIPINDIGLYFSTAIVVAVTGGISLTDNTSISSGCSVSYSWI